MIRLIAPIIIFILIPTWAFPTEIDSICYGTTSKGRLEGGISLPKSGKNFISYSFGGNLLGRTYVHRKIHDIILKAYKNLETSYPEKVFMYGETGWENGGRFRPHKTHQNGLSVDFMVPVLNNSGKSVYLPTNLLNKFGYAIEFDNDGRFKNYIIDFEAIAEHLIELHKVATAAGIEISIVIFDPKLQPYLFKTQNGEYLKNNLKFSKKLSWVRHDEHYHVDFKLDCRPL